MAIEVSWGAATHVGRVRQANQDSILAGPTVFAVADGMGGHAAGDVASALAVGALARLHSGGTADDLLAAVLEANATIIGEAGRGSGREGMGTTVTGLCLAREQDRDVIVVFNVGDSRTYRFEAGALTQVTHDHSLVAEMVRDGELTEEGACVHPARNVVTRALGIGIDLDIDHWRELPRPGVRYLICSDGLVGEVPDVELATLLGAALDPQAQADALVDQALEAGAHDNVSVVIVVIAAVDGAEPDAEEDTSPRGVPVVDEAAGGLIESVPGVTRTSPGGAAPGAAEAPADEPLLTGIPSGLQDGDPPSNE